MKQKHRIPAKALSFLLALVMLVGCISVGFTAFAVEDTYQVLAAAIRADGMQGVIPLYKSSTSPGVKSKLAASDPHATSAVYVQSAAMWSAMDAFWKAAGALRSKDVGDIVVGDNGNIYEGWTGENNTARKIASAVAAKLAAGGYMTADEQRLYDVTGIFNWFIGSPTAENALLDAPVRGEKPAFQPWSLQVFGTTGYFGATRTRDQALFAGTKNYKQIPATLELNRRWEWAHDARSASNSAGTVRQYWHVLSKMDTAGNVAGAAGLPFDPAQANTAALKAALSAWDGTFDKAFFKQDLSAMGTDQLNAVKANVEAKILAVKELDVTNSLLYFYGLPTFMDVGTFQRKLDYHLDLAPFRPYVSFFKNAKASKLKNMNMDALSKEVLAARTNYSALQVVQYSSKNIFNGLVEENGLDMAAAEEYVSEVQYEISSPAGRDALVAYVANLINSNLEWDGADDEDGTGSFALKPDFFVWRNADGTQNGAAISLEDLYGLYESLAMANEALIGKIGDTPDFTLKNPEFPGTIPGSSPPEPEPEFIPFRWDVALHEKTGLPYKYAIQYRGADAVNKALSAILQAIADRNPNLYYDYYGKKPPGVNAPYPGFPGISAAYPDGFPNSILPDPPALYEYERLPAGFITKNPNPGKAPSAPAAQGSMSDAAYATLLEGYINNVLTPWNPYIAKPVATKPDRASSPWLGNDVLYISDANLYITQALANWTAADTSTMTTVIWADSLTNPTTTTAFVGTVYDYAAYFIVNPMDTDADFWAWAVGFASDAGFAARLLAVNASYAEQGFTPGDIPDVPNPDDYDVTPHNSIIEAIVDDNGYALAWNDYIQQVIALYDTMVVNYNRWKLTHDWTEYYETYIATVPAAGDPRGAYTPPVAPATEGTYANPVPERKDFPVNKTDPPDMLGDIAYLTAAEAYASGLDAAQLKYIVDIGGVTYGGSVGSVTFATSDIYDVKNPKYVSLAETPLEPEYLPRKDLTEAQSFMLAIGMINWAPNAAYPSGTGQIVDGVTYATEMEARYVYLTKDLPNRMNLNADYANEMKRRLTIPQNAYYNMVQRQMEFEEAIRTGTDADVIAARNKLQTAVSNYNNLLTNGGWTIDGSTNMGIGANNSAYIIPGLADAITDYTAVNNRLTSLRMYGLFFNPYRMSLVDVDWNFQGWGVMPLVTSDWNRFSDNDLRSELEAAKAALKAYMDDTTYGNNLTHWADPTNSAYREWDKYIGREDGSTGYIPGPNGEDALSLYGVIRARVMRLLSVMNPAYGLDGYLGVDPNFIMDQLTGAFNFPGSGPPGKPQADANDYNINTIGLYLLLATTEYRIDDKDDEIAFARRLLAAFRGLLIDYSSLHPTLLGEEDSDLPFPDTDFYPLREVDGGSAIVLKIKQDEFVVRYEHIENLINKLDTLVSSQLMTQLAPAFGLSSSGSSPSEAAPGTDTSSAPPPYYGPDAAFHVPRLEGHIIMRLG
ncbi:MAG: hypothetical protein FWC27_07810, partial [Firmicutes bacterium]|nr:hypothetical protein [Bacillota bacterium]